MRSSLVMAVPQLHGGARVRHMCEGRSHGPGQGIRARGGHYGGLMTPRGAAATQDSPTRAHAALLLTSPRPRLGRLLHRCLPSHDAVGHVGGACQAEGVLAGRQAAIHRNGEVADAAQVGAPPALPRV